MSWTQIVVLAIVQGLTEFLPISSSGHLVLVPGLVGWPDQGLVFDVAVHFGSLLAVCLYFRNDVVQLLHGGASVLRGNIEDPYARLAFGIGIATIPVATAGYLCADFIEANLRSPNIIVVTLSGFGILLFLADRFGPKTREFSRIRLKDTVIIGIAQMLALVPGTSRSGVTITAAMALGLRRQDAARFSFLLSVPAIALATAYKVYTMFRDDIQANWAELGVAVVISAFVAYLSIEFFMRVVNAIGVLPFAIYRVLLAGFVFYVFF